MAQVRGAGLKGGASGPLALAMVYLALVACYSGIWQADVAKVCAATERLKGKGYTHPIITLPHMHHALFKSGM